jgi:hypothetical protein
MELRIIVFHGTEERIHTDLGGEFLMNLPLQSLLWRFPRFHLPTRKLPPVLPFAVASLRGENLILFAYDRCYYFYLAFHVGAKIR